MFDSDDSESEWDGEKEARGEPTEDRLDSESCQWPGVKDAISFAAQLEAELKVFRPFKFGFLARGSSIGSSKLEPTAAFKALILVSFREAVRFFRELEDFA